MNWPNRLSLIRIASVPVIVVLMLLPSSRGTVLAALAVFMLASFTDWLDGQLARKYNLITNFGKFIDPVADKLLVLSTMCMLCGRGAINPAVLVVVLFRELAVDGLRLVAVEKGLVIAAGKLGKLKTVSQMFMLISFLLLEAGVITSALVPTVLLALAVGMTVWSGVDYFVRNKGVLRG